MKTKKTVTDTWPQELTEAVSQYPRITASPDFNKRVLEALAAKQTQQSKLDVFCDALDRIFERRVFKVFATFIFAILLAWGGSSLISTFAFPNLSKPSNLTTSQQTYIHSQSLNALSPGANSLYAQQSGLHLQIPSTNNTQQSPSAKVLLPARKESSCSPNETIFWG